MLILFCNTAIDFEKEFAAFKLPGDKGSREIQGERFYYRAKISYIQSIFNHMMGYFENTLEMQPGITYPDISSVSCRTSSEKFYGSN